MPGLLAAPVCCHVVLVTDGKHLKNTSCIYFFSVAHKQFTSVCIIFLLYTQYGNSATNQSKQKIENPSDMTQDKVMF